MPKTLILLSLSCLLLSCNSFQNCCPVGAQENGGTKSSQSSDPDNRVQSDLYIDKERTFVEERKDHLYLEAVVVTDNDDDAQHIELIVNLPVEIEHSSFSGYLRSGSKQKKIDCNQCGHVIKCYLNRLSKLSIAPSANNEEIFFTAKIGKPRFDVVEPRIGVTAISHFPADPIPSNNTFYWHP